jgi:hydrogenase large subunit
MTRLTIDPVTRVGGQLRVEVDVSGGIVQDAWVSGTMYRGIERILEGRDPRDAWLMAQRICGVDGVAHARASVEAIEQALGSGLPANARLIRNLLSGTQLVVDHVSAFYQRQMFDWVDVPAALAADPATAAGVAAALGGDASEALLRSVRDRLATELQSGQPGLFASPMWGHPGYHVPPALGLVILAHYLEALDWRRRIMRIHTSFGGKQPHPQAFLLGGMAAPVPWAGQPRPVDGEHQWALDRNAPPPLGQDGLATIGQLLQDASDFVTGTFAPDVLAVVAVHADEPPAGAGIGHFLAFGAFPEDGSDRPALVLPRGRVMDRDVTRLVEVGEAGIAESLSYAWYADEAPALRRPTDARATPSYTGPRPPYTTLAGSDRYSWVKAPRYEDDPMEVGPLARMLVGEAAGDARISSELRRATGALGGDEQLFGTLGRIVAGAVEAQVVVGRLAGWLDDLRAGFASGDLAIADASTWNPRSWPSRAEGVSIAESAHGALGHWVSIADGRIERYDVVDGSTWTASPRDGRGRRGALEQALVGLAIADPDRPLEVLRTIHAVDPCLACAVH